MLQKIETQLNEYIPQALIYFQDHQQGIEVRVFVESRPEAASYLIKDSTLRILQQVDAHKQERVIRILVDDFLHQLKKKE